MKSTVAILLGMILTLSFAACGGNPQTTTPPSSTNPSSQSVSGTPSSGSAPVQPEPESGAGNGQPETAGETENEQPGNETDAGVSSEEETAGNHILIAYFTVPETDGIDTVANASRVATENGVMGNMEFVAAEIQKNIDGDLFAIQTVQEYPGTHAPLLEFAYNELRENARPELSTAIPNLDQYDTVFIGFPNWNADLPMPLYSFFDEYDFSGKTLIPFVTHGGSGFSGTIRTIQELEPEAAVIESGLSISRNNVPTAQADVKAWIDSLREQGTV